MKTAIIILAAGKGKRMESDIPKVLHKLNNKSLIKRVIETSKKMSPLKMILVIGHKKEMIKKELENYTDIEYVIQSEQKGTGHAVKMCFNALQGFDGDILILSGDVPLISFSTLQSLRDIKNQLKAHAAILTANMDSPTGYGRIIKNNQLLSKIVEHKDCTPYELSVNEINAGVYLIENRLLMEYIPKIDNQNNITSNLFCNVVTTLN